VSDALRRRLELFVRHFAAPLVGGGTLRIGMPIGERELRFFTSGIAVESEATAAIIDARDRVAGEIAVRPPVLPPIDHDETAMRLLAATHNVLVLWHPALRAGLIARRARLRIRDFTQRLVESIPPARDAREAISMHSVLWNLPRVRRVDRTVRFWAGTRRFVGQAPPRRLVAFPRLRRVSVDEEERTLLADASADPPASARGVSDEPIVAALLARSPITDLCNARAGFRATVALGALASPAVERYVIDRLLARGLGTPGLGAALAGALLEALSSGAVPAEVLRSYAGLLVHLIEAVAYTGGPPAIGALLDAARPLVGVVAVLLEAAERGDAGPGIGAAPSRLTADGDRRVAEVGRALGSLVLPGAIETLLGEADAEAARLAVRRRFME
jgi:hypothetical protein